MSRLVKILIGAVVVLGIMLLALPHLVNVESYRGKIIARAESTLKRKVSIGAMHLSIFPLALRAEKITISDDPAFSSADFATVDAVLVRVGLGGLLGGRLEIDSIEAIAPSVTLIKDEQGAWNTDSLTTQKVQPGIAAGGAVATAPQLEVAKLKITDGAASIFDHSKQKTSQQAFDHINLTLDNLAPGRPFDFQLDMNTVSVSGKGGPLAGENLPITAHVKFDKLEIANVPDSEASGLLTGTMEIQSDGAIAKFDGDATIDKLQASAKGRPSTVPVSAKYQGEYVVGAETLRLTSVAIKVGDTAAAQISGSINRKKPAENLLTMKADNAALVEIGKLLPALGVLLPNNSSFASGTVTHSGDFHGPLTPLNGEASLNVHNAKLTGFSVAQQISSVATLAGISAGNDTEINELRCHTTFVNGASTFSGIELVIPGLTVSGTGTVSAEGALNFRLNALLTKNNAVGVLSRLAGGSGGVPFSVQGTTANPRFTPDVGGIAKKEIGGSLGKALGGLLGRKP